MGYVFYHLCIIKNNFFIFSGLLNGVRAFLRLPGCIIERQLHGGIGYHFTKGVLQKKSYIFIQYCPQLLCQ
jgi:hypothetical protein